MTQQLPTKPNMADLAKIAVGVPTHSKSSLQTNVARPSLSDLAKVNLKTSSIKALNSHNPHRPLYSESSSSSNIVGSGSLNLALALRNKCNIGEKRKVAQVESFSKSLSILPIEVTESREPDQSLICKKASPLGRVIGTEASPSKTLFPKYNRPTLGRYSSFALKPFDFTSPSPDDLIKSRLRLA